MSNGDEDGADDEGADEEAAEGVEPPAKTIESRLDDAAASMEAAESEATLDGVESTLEDIEDAIADADLPEPAEEGEAEEGEGDADEDAEGEAPDPRAELEDRLESLRTDLEEKRGPYTEDVAEEVRAAAATLEEGTWSEGGAADARDAVERFLASAGEFVNVEELAEDVIEPDDGEEPTYALPGAVEALEDAADAIGGATLDPDDDAEIIGELVSAAETLQDDLEAADEWDDLSMRAQLDALGFYDDLTSENRVDFPPEWSAMKSHAAAENVAMLLSVLEKMGDADFMEEYVFEQLHHLGRGAAPAFEEMHERAQKRNQAPIEILGKIADERACETLHEFVEGDGDPGLQVVTLRALGEIGSEDSTGPIADRLAAEESEVRSAAARALGLVGDTRAIDPLAEVLAEDDAIPVRASAAWALRQIGTERARDELGEYADDRAYIVQAEAVMAGV